MERDTFTKQSPNGSLRSSLKTRSCAGKPKPLECVAREDVDGRRLHTNGPDATGGKAAARPARALQVLRDTNARHRPLPSTKRSPEFRQSVTTQRRARDNKSINYDQLWAELRNRKMAQFMRSTASSRQRSGGSTTPRSAPSETSRTSNDPKKAKLRDADFRQRVLLPRGISFPSETESSDAFAHFGTELPLEGYGALEQMQHTNVWIPTDDQLIENVIREFTYMRNEQLCEAEFANYATENLLRRDPRYPSYDETREWRVERMVELLVKPSTSANSRLRPPPITVSADSLEYDFNFRPDLQYWLSVRPFNPVYR
ncbi:hypothetical protein VCV18_012687 [Metarhizium anisopliae]